MDANQLDALIALLQDRSARVDERDDAAIDLGSTDDPRAASALFQVGSRPDENETVLASCGESLAQIAIRTGHFDPAWPDQLAPSAARELLGTVRAERLELLEP
jgi:hypothetical protein